jgi:hypothetical protein
MVIDATGKTQGDGRYWVSQGCTLAQQLVPAQAQTLKRSSS